MKIGVTFTTKADHGLLEGFGSFYPLAILAAAIHRALRRCDSGSDLDITPATA